jgi:hypothetical protein
MKTVQVSGFERLDMIIRKLPGAPSFGSLSA